MELKRGLLLAALAATAAGCGHDPTGARVGPETSMSVVEGLPAGLRVEFTVEPGEVAQWAPFDVTLNVTNTTSEEIQVVTAHGCLVLPHVFRNGTRVPFVGTAWGCTAAITTHRFPPGGTRSYHWRLRAELYAEHPGDVEDAPAPTGAYRVTAIFDTFSEQGLLAKPMVERALRVR
jgi:hypothetical protein